MRIRIENITPADKVVLITGGGTGIGRAAARLFAARGARVALAGRREPPLAEAADAICAAGGKAFAVSGDVTDEKSVRRIIRSVREKAGRIDVLVNNAGQAERWAMIHQITDEMWQGMLETNLTGAFRMARAVLPHFMEQRQGVIVNVSSIAALVGMPGIAPYSIAKSGLVALTRSIAAEYAPLGIRCNCVCPGLTETSMTKDSLRPTDARRYNALRYPVRKLGTPGEIAEAIVFLSSSNAFLTGAVLTVDGGYTCV